MRRQRRPLLPRLDITGDDSQQRVRLRIPYRFESTAQFGIADCEFRQQTIPLLHELAARDRNAIGALRTADLPRGKCVAATRRFLVNATKVLGDRAAGRGLSPKAMQLRVMPVAVRSPTQYGLRQERLAPESNETAGVEVFGMHGPETHVHRALQTKFAASFVLPTPVYCATCG
jgi:hypothetical protein